MAKHKKKASAKPARRKAPRRPRQVDSEDLGATPKNALIEEKIDQLLDAQGERMLWEKTEREYRTELQALLTKFGFTVEKGYQRAAKDFKFEAWLESSEVKVKVRKKPVG